MITVKKRFLFTAAFVLATSAITWANVPPPPVNQFLGIPDSSFNNLVEADCRVCHEDPTIVDPGTIPDRHHLLVGTPLPDPTSAPFVQPGDTTYECLSCHQQVWDPVNMSFVFVNFRDCLFCHEQIPNEASVHHLTARAQNQDCKGCHGPVDNPGDGHYIPSYAPSLVTPYTSNKPNAGPNGEGSCVFCHNTGLDTVSNLLVLTNAETHHSTGFGSDPTKCSWCHDFSMPRQYYIRKCEECHGPDSLHNIQVDSDNPDNPGEVVPGMENAYWGHIGNNDDCFGCHGFTAMSAAAPYSGPVIPDLVSLDVLKVTEGSGAVVTASGGGFVNTIDNAGTPIVLTSNVTLTGPDGKAIELAPTSITENSLTVTLPADMAAGNYLFRVVKADKTSNPINLSVVPAMVNNNIVCRGTSVTVKGKGFSEFVDAVGSGTSMTAYDRARNVIDCSVRTWTDKKITASCTACPDSVTIESVWGADTDRVRTLRPSRRR